MPRASTKQSRRQSLDLDEIAPSRFLVHNTHVVALLKGEGEFAGRLFELTTWRREGLLARLQERGFGVRTIADRIAGLAAPPAPPPIGAPGWRVLSRAAEHFSRFDIERIDWRPLEPETRDGAAGVTLCEGWVIRRRIGRGIPSFYLAFRERGGGIGLRALGETEALLTGYAQAVAHDPRPWLIERRGDEIALPEVALPPPYREVLALFAREGKQGWLVEQERGWELAQELFGRLGVRLSIED